MAAAVIVQLCLCRKVTGTPRNGTVVYVVKSAPNVSRNSVITVSGQAPELCILIKGVASAGIGHEAEKSFAAKIINPGQGRLWGGDDIFSVDVVEHSVLHFAFSPLKTRYILNEIQAWQEGFLWGFDLYY
jgi:hypothetical protein